MHSWTIIGAVLLFFFSSISLTLPLIPRVASDPSTSVVERRWKPARLLPRVSRPQELDAIPNKVGEPFIQVSNDKLIRFSIHDKNPVLKSLFDREEPSHPQEAALGRPQQAPSIYDTVTTDYPVDPQTGESEVVSSQTTSTQSTVDPAAIADTNTTSNATSPVSVVSSDTTGFKFRVSADSPLAKLYGRAKSQLRALGKREDQSLSETTVQDFDPTAPPPPIPLPDANTAAAKKQGICGGDLADPFCNKLGGPGVNQVVNDDDVLISFAGHGTGNRAVSNAYRGGR
ncbi:MAG: hypothetical protein Q9198_002794 [Flavoplaca austrocitrina]